MTTAALMILKTVICDTYVTQKQLYPKNDNIPKFHREWNDFAFIYQNT